MNSSDLSSLEVAVLQTLLAGDHPVLAVLRSQLDGLTMNKRELTGVGFFTELSVTKPTSSNSILPSGQLRFGDVEAVIGELAHGAGFLLYVDGGMLRMLEGYSYDVPWPEVIAEFSVRYSGPTRTALLAQLG